MSTREFSRVLGAWSTTRINGTSGFNLARSARFYSEIALDLEVTSRCSNQFHRLHRVLDGDASVCELHAVNILSRSQDWSKQICRGSASLSNRQFYLVVHVGS